MIPQTKSAIMPDISRPNILVMVAVKYAIMAIASIMKVSVTTEVLRNRKCLNIYAVPNPKKSPYATETTARISSCSTIKNGVPTVNFWPYKLITALNMIIETMSFVTPSPKMHEKSFGCASKSTIETAATTSDEQSSEQKTRIYMIESSTFLVTGTPSSVTYLVISKSNVFKAQ